jgi:CRISPR-associated protein Csm1
LIEQLADADTLNCPDSVRYVAHHIPRDGNNDPVTFEKLADKNVWTDENGDERGMRMLGVLKADADRMGLLFGKGLEKLSIARVAALSRMVNGFFGGYLHQLLQRDYPDIYTVFCGGDDLFLIGPWETMVEFADKMQRDFTRWTATNPNVTISAGLVFCKSNYPVHRAAEMAGEALEKSKEFRNRFTVFNTTLEWKDFPELRKFKDFLNEKFQDKNSKIKSAFLYRLLNYHQMYLRSTNTGDYKGQKNDPTGLRFHALMTYDITRNIKQIKDDRVINLEELEELERLHKIVGPDRVLLDHLRVPIWWTIYRNRKYSPNKQERR